MAAIMNGRISNARLQQVDGWAWLAPGAAAAWLLFAFHATMRWGVRPTITRPDGAYRSYARQLWWWVNRFIRRVVVARPGTSNHGLGMAIDVYNWARFPRGAFVQMAAAHGFFFDTRSERWHMRYLGSPKYRTVSPSGGTAILITTGDVDMRIIFNTAETNDDKKRIIVGEHSWQHITKAQATREVKLFGKPVNMTGGETAAELASVNLRRASIGQPPLVA